MEITEMLKYIFQNAYMIGLCVSCVVLIVLWVQCVMDWKRYDSAETVYGTLVKVKIPRGGKGLATCYYDVEINNNVKRFKKGVLFNTGNVGEQHALKYDPKRKRVLRDKNLTMCYMITVPIMLAIVIYVIIWTASNG